MRRLGFAVDKSGNIRCTGQSKGGPTTEARKRKTAANERLRAAVAPLPTTNPVPFLCECSDPECLGRVEMTLDEYGQTRASDELIRLAEHRENATNGA
jgi:hypothetical protein